jgi:hypothetical protein
MLTTLFAIDPMLVTFWLMLLVMFAPVLLIVVMAVLAIILVAFVVVFAVAFVIFTIVAVALITILAMLSYPTIYFLYLRTPAKRQSWKEYIAKLRSFKPIPTEKE